jgi:23S rRNA (uracil1939-C5)-methyltransferase
LLSNQRNHEFVVRIDSLVYGGSGISHLPDGRVVFVPFVLPAEEVKIRIRAEKSGYVQAELVEVLQPSKKRLIPRCRHFGSCGGCHYQHIPYEHQLEFKKAIFLEQWQRLGGIVQPDISMDIKSSLEWNYRNTVQFHLSQRGKPGYERAGSHETLEIIECHLPCPELNDIWPRLDFESLSDIDRIELKLGSDGKTLLTLYSSNPTPPEFYADWPISAVHLSPPGEIILVGEDYVEMKILDRTLRVSAGSFFQVNLSITEEMVKCLLEIIQLNNEMMVLDVYCGVGLFSSFIAPQVKKCVGIEISSAACRDYAFNLDEYDNVELYEGPAEEVLPILDVKPDLIIVDPPRSGLADKALTKMIAMAPRQIVYISCNPSTFVRDAKLLFSACYHLDKSILLDMFPQTFHIESLNSFSRN